MRCLMTVSCKLAAVSSYFQFCLFVFVSSAAEFLYFQKRKELFLNDLCICLNRISICRAGRSLHLQLKQVN